jgi:hypothetical protein
MLLLRQVQRQELRARVVTEALVDMEVLVEQEVLVLWGLQVMPEVRWV